MFAKTMGRVGTVWMLVVVMAGCALLSVAAQGASSSAAPAAGACAVTTCVAPAKASFCEKEKVADGCEVTALTDAQKDDFLKVVNDDRQKAAMGTLITDNPAKQLFKLVWSINGATASQNYAVACAATKNPCADIPTKTMTSIVITGLSKDTDPKDILATLTLKNITKEDMKYSLDKLTANSRLIFLAGTVTEMACSVGTSKTARNVYCSFGPSPKVDENIYKTTPPQCVEPSKPSALPSYNLLCELPSTNGSAKPDLPTLNQNKTRNGTKAAAVHHSGLPRMYVAAVVLYSLTQP